MLTHTLSTDILQKIKLNTEEIFFHQAKIVWKSNVIWRYNWTPHLPTLSHHLSGRPIALRSSPLVYPAYAHHSTDKSICQPVCFTTPHLPNLHITCSVYPSTCNHPYAKFSISIVQYLSTVKYTPHLPILHITWPVDLSICQPVLLSTTNPCTLRSGSPRLLSCLPVKQTSYPPLIYPPST